jgi:putative DNA primase/helicase
VLDRTETAAALNEPLAEEQQENPATAAPPTMTAGRRAKPRPGAAGVGEESDTAADGSPSSKAKKPEKKIDWGKYNELLENFALIYGTDTVWDGVNRLIMKVANMAHAHGSDMVKMWKASEKRRTIMPSHVVFDPTGQCERPSVNLFDGIELEPRNGDVKPVLELVRFLTSRASADSDECDNIMHWLLCWMAYPLRRLGTKLRTAVIMHGDEGAGKNFLFDLLVEIYGKYGALVGQDELEDKFNDWRSAKLFVVGDEVSSRQELVHNKNRLKALITSTTVQINPKNLPRREERNHINIVFLSNELQPLALDNSDRRYLVIYTPRAREFEFYRTLKAWKEAGGLAAFYEYLLHYPLDDFDPYAPAPLTQAKMDLIEMNLKSPERFWLEWSGGELDLPYRTCSTAQAYRAYKSYAARTGERFPAQRNVFTRMVVRISEARAEAMNLEPALEWRTNVVDPEGNRRTQRLLLVAGIPDGVTQGHWAEQCIAAFEPELAKYVGHFGPRSPDGAEPQTVRGAN